MTRHYSRRNFIKKSALWTAAGTLPVAGTASAVGTDPVLVSVFLRGGADAVNICIPYGDDAYYSQRPGIGVRSAGYTDLDGFFGLNNSFSGLLPLFRNQELGIVHCAGSRDNSRSHFEAMDYMDAATPGNRTTPTGWLQRSLAALNPTTSHAGISIGKQVNPALRGPAATSTMKRVRELRRQRTNLSSVRDTLTSLYDPNTDAVLGGTVDSAFSSLDALADVPIATDVQYPLNTVARSFREVAALIKADIGVRVVAINYGGWDHHTDEVNRMNGRGDQLSGALAAFREDLGEDFGRTLTLCMTEFGRTVKENGNDGTDHGHGSMMMALGSGLVGVGGGKVLLADNKWPGLRDEQLNRGRYLPVTTDFRDVFAEVLDKHMNLSGSLRNILPGHTLPARYPGLI